ncbi:ANL family adenylate-forming protein [Raineyella fluvialis]|uniref:AMP-binding protein n=1 Tax=Raineyella fluvialis TaxID=2662261 RepID=A0A5Q2F9E3_9ACTN|nr:fatty acid--CoA ligase family protein [Raineyella fluvialis]QGF23590.1 AMP-binding protein [Raineyella fluvialis]
MATGASRTVAGATNRIVSRGFTGSWADLDGYPLPPAAAVFVHDHAEAVRAVWTHATTDRETLVASLTRADDSLITDLESAGLAIARAEGAEVALLPAAVERAAHSGRIWLLTSGSTGRPKRVAHTLDSLTTVKGDQPARTWLCPYTPGAYAWWQLVTLSLAHPGNDLVFVEPDQLEDWPQLALEHGVTAVSGTPTFWRQALVRAGDTMARLPLEQITLGGEPVDQAVLDRLHTVYPEARISWIYASSEAGAAIAVHDGRAGFPVEWLDRDTESRPRLSVVDDELVIRSPFRAEGMDPDLRTGDRVEIRDGRVLIIGRLASDEINVGGSKASAAVVRTVLLDHPAVAWAAVKGRRAPIVGQMVTAEVVLAPGADASTEDLATWCAARLPEYAVPRRLRILPQIPIKESLKSDV